MIVAGQSITTPKDSPQYDLDWRARLARVWVGNLEADMPLLYADDPWLEAQMGYLADQRMASNSTLYQTRPTTSQKANDLHLQYASPDLVNRLQALLLSDADMPTIAQDTGLSESVVKYYCRVFYDVRNKQWTRPESGIQLMQFAYSGGTRLMGYGAARDYMMWKVVGVAVGYTGLAYQWGLPNPAGELKDTRELVEQCFNSSVGQMLAKYVTGQTPMVEIQAMFGNYIAYERMQREGEKGLNEAAEALWALLQALAPKLSEHSNTQALGAAAQEKTLQEQAVSSMEAAKEIGMTEIEDNGPVDPNDLLNAQIKTHLAPLKSPHEKSEADDASD